MPKTSRAPPTVSGVSANHVSGPRDIEPAGIGPPPGLSCVRTSSGRGSGTTPFGKLTPTVAPSADERRRVVANVAWTPLAEAVHFSVEPKGPWKQAAVRIEPLAGSVTVAVRELVGTCQPLPFTFQYSSSWSAKPFSIPDTR